VAGTPGGANRGTGTGVRTGEAGVIVPAKGMTKLQAAGYGGPTARLHMSWH
jgi:hypothetical protein